jgi:hypothetical protein
MAEVLRSMLRSRNSFRKIFIFRYLLLFLQFTPQTGAACGLPVCDIQAEIRVFEDKGQGYRFQYISKLRSSFSKEKDEQKLNNLLSFAKEAIAVISRLRDEDYVLREAKSLKDQTLFSLLQWVWRDCERLGDAYGQLAGEAQRYAALDFFLRKVPEFRSEELIKNLVCFAQSAEKESRMAGDPEYIARHALSLASALSMQFLEVYNGWEGVFRLTHIDGPLKEELEKLKLILFSSSGELGIVAAIAHPTFPPMVFQKVSFQDAAQILVSRQSFASPVPSVIELKFNESFTEVSGWILEPVLLEKTYFSAVRTIRVSAAAERPCSDEQFIGQYQTVLADHDGIFSLQKLGSGQYAGAFSTAGGEFRLAFAFGRYNTATGRVSLVNMQTNVPLVWRLTAELDDQNRCQLTGWGLSSFNSVAYPMLLRKIVTEN